MSSAINMVSEETGIRNCDFVIYAKLMFFVDIWFLLLMNVKKIKHVIVLNFYGQIKKMFLSCFIALIISIESLFAVEL